MQSVKASVIQVIDYSSPHAITIDNHRVGVFAFDKLNYPISGLHNVNAAKRVLGFLQQLQHAEKFRLHLYEARKDSRWKVDTNYDMDSFGPEEFNSLDDKADARVQELREYYTLRHTFLTRLGLPVALSGPWRGSQGIVRLQCPTATCILQKIVFWMH